MSEQVTVAAPAPDFAASGDFPEAPKPAGAAGAATPAAIDPAIIPHLKRITGKSFLRMVRPVPPDSNVETAERWEMEAGDSPNDRQCHSVPGRRLRDELAKAAPAKKAK